MVANFLAVSLVIYCCALVSDDAYTFKMTMTTDDMVFIFCSNVVFIPWLALMIAPK